MNKQAPQSGTHEKLIVVTGGTGFIGSRCAVELARRGYRVRVADPVTPGERGLIFPETIEFVQGTISDPRFARRALEGANTVLHLAANIGAVGYMHERAADILRDNMRIDVSLYQQAMETGRPCIVYGSSSMVYQHAPRYPYREENLYDTPPPTNIYGMSKLVGEYFCRSYFSQYGLPFVIMRYHNVYGPGELIKGEGAGNIHVIPALIKKALAGQYPLELLGGEDATRPFTYIDDAVDASVMIVERALLRDGAVIGNDFNIGPREAKPIVDIARVIWDAAGTRDPFQYVVKSTDAITSVRREMIPDKIENIIGWKPKTDLHEGIAKTVEWIKNMNVA